MRSIFVSFSCLQEQALLGSQARRRATVVCLENCELLTIDSDYFTVTGLHQIIADRVQQQYYMMRFSQFESLCGVVYCLAEFV